MRLSQGAPVSPGAARALFLDGPQLQVDGRCQTGNNPRGATCPRRRRRSTGLRCRGSRLRYRGWAADPTRPGLEHSSCPNAAGFYGFVGIGVKEAKATFRGGARQSLPCSLGPVYSNAFLKDGRGMPVIAVRNAVGHRSRRACDIDEKGERLQPASGRPRKEVPDPLRKQIFVRPANTI